MLLVDTCIVQENVPKVLTHLSSKTVKDVVYSFNKDDGEKEKRPKVKAETMGGSMTLTRATLVSDNKEMSKRGLRRQHQGELGP